METPGTSQGGATMIDERSAKNIATLKPEVQPLATRLVEIAQARGINARVISGHRSYDEQNELYAQGRSKPGQIVTKAKGGQSWHNFGLAFSSDGKKYYGESASYAEVGKIGEAIGLEWGGNWEFVDEPHFQFNPQRYSLAQMREKTEEGKSLFT